MSKRLAAWVLLAMLGPQAVAGCGESESSDNPLTPTPPPPTAPTPPPRSLPVDLTGSYGLTFEVGSGCEHVPKELRSRTYEARIEYHRSDGSTDMFLASLSGATFHNQLPVAIEVTHRDSGASVWLDLAPSDNVILEEPHRGTYLMVAGGAGAASARPTELSTISALFTGYFNYCVATSDNGSQNQCSFDTMIRSLCKSENSRWTMTRH